MRFDGIEIGLVDTWPNGLQRLLNDNLGLLREHAKEEMRIEELSWDDLQVRYNPPPIPHAAVRAVLVEEANAFLSDQIILGFHCTRLSETDVETIRIGGLEPLSSDLLKRRLHRCVETGALVSEQVEIFNIDNQTAHKYRRDRIWFVYSRNLLNNELGLYRLFQSWGGEALYGCHENNPETKDVLRSIGRPCIVVAAMPVASVKYYGITIGERFVGAFLDRHNVETIHDIEFSGHVRTRIEPNSIKSFIFYGEKVFEELTGCSDWRRPIA